MAALEEALRQAQTLTALLQDEVHRQQADREGQDEGEEGDGAGNSRSDR